MPHSQGNPQSVYIPRPNALFNSGHTLEDQWVREGQLSVSEETQLPFSLHK